MDKSRAIIPEHFRQCGSFSNIVTKFDDDPLKNIQVTERTRFILANLAIRLGRDILQTNIFTKFDDDTMKTTEIIERINALDAAGPRAYKNGETACVSIESILSAEI